MITIFSQYGEPVFLKLARDKESGKSKGFGWLKYEDQRSTDLAVDNLGGAEIGGRLIRVDHARYKPRDDEDPDEFKVGWEDVVRKEKKAKGEDVEMEDVTDEEEAERARRPVLREERELAKLIAEHDEDDPMKSFLIEEKKQEVQQALEREERKGKSERKHRHRHRDDDGHHHRHRDHHHNRSHRSRGDGSTESSDRHKRPRRDETPVAEARDGRSREETPERRRGGSPERERERRGRDDDRDRHRDHRERKSRRGDGHSHDERRSSRRDVEEPEKDRRRKHWSRSRSKSPRSNKRR